MIDTDVRNRLDSFVLQEHEGSYHTEMSELDQFGYTPEEDNEGRFYFVININGKDVRFYQSDEYPNVFSDEYITQAWVFSPENDEFKNVELHIINDYE